MNKKTVSLLLILILLVVIYFAFLRNDNTSLDLTTDNEYINFEDERETGLVLFKEGYYYFKMLAVSYIYKGNYEYKDNKLILYMNEKELCELVWNKDKNALEIVKTNNGLLKEGSVWKKNEDYDINNQKGYNLTFEEIRDGLKPSIQKVE